MSNINQKVAALLENNREAFGGKPIAFDGVVDEDTYLNSDIKTLFLLKEVNDPEMNNDWISFMDDIKLQVNKESMYKTWPNVCLWIEALHNPNVEYTYCVDENGNFATKKLQRNLLEVAVVNIKKTAGGGSSNYDEILDAANRYGNVIREEIENCISPQLVICGGTFDYAKIMFNVKDSEVCTFPSGAEYFTKNGILYLQFVHPMWFSVNRKILFAYAKDVFADVLELFSLKEKNTI